MGEILTGVAFETTFITVGHTGTTVESTGIIFIFPNVLLLYQTWILLNAFASNQINRLCQSKVSN